MFKSNTAKNSTKFFLVLLISFWVMGCSSTPQNELVIDNVFTERQKKEARAQAQAAEKAKTSQASSMQTAVVALNKPPYPMVTFPPIMNPVTAPNPVAYAKDSSVYGTPQSSTLTGNSGSGPDDTSPNE